MWGPGKVISTVFMISVCCAARAGPSMTALPSMIAGGPPLKAPSDNVADSTEKSEYAIPTRTDHSGRMIASVTINGRGPLRFMVDTGSNHTVLSESALAKLGLTADANTFISVAGISGSQQAPSVHIAALDAGDLHFREVDLAVLGGPVFNGLDGILGMDGFNGMKVFADFDKDLMTISQSKGKRPDLAYSVVPVQFLSERLLMVDSRVGRLVVKTIIDTGGSHTLGNLALLEALTRTRQDDAHAHHAGVIDVTQVSKTAMIGRVPDLQMGDAHIQGLDIVFGDFQIFNTWGLEEQPTLLIGMDVLGTLKALDIDYRRKEVAFLSRLAPRRAMGTKWFSFNTW
jgi:clan AA aspartic protease (TIGR02281 family)